MNNDKKPQWSNLWLKIQQSKNTVTNFFASSMGALFAELFTLPICTIKTNFQNNFNHASVWATCRHMKEQYGIKGFFNASGWAVTSQMLSTSSKYVLFEKIKSVMGDEQQMVENKSRIFLAGALSGALSSLLTHPFDVYKIHKQMQSTNKITRNIWYRGYSKTLTKAVTGSILYFPIYNICTNFFQEKHNIVNDSKRDRLLFVTLPSSFVSSVISTTLLHPIDFLKTRQIYGQAKLPPFNWKTVHSVMFRGLGLNLTRVVPHFIITMCVIEAIKSILE